MMTVKGDVTDVVRNNGKTEAVCVDGNNIIHLELDEGLVEFGKLYLGTNVLREQKQFQRYRYKRQRL